VQWPIYLPILITTLDGTASFHYFERLLIFFNSLKKSFTPPFLSISIMTEFLYLSFGAGVILCLWILRASYPHPYSGIPYNKHAAKRIMGDLPDLLEMGRKTKLRQSSSSNNAASWALPSFSYLSGPSLAPSSSSTMCGRWAISWPIALRSLIVHHRQLAS
jgi:hypothetical protein